MALKNIIIIGGGPAGMMAAITARTSNNRVRILEKNNNFGKKLLLTGDGRCNLTSTYEPGEIIDSEIFMASNFLYSALYSFSPADTWRFFNDLGVELKEERGRRVYPVSNKSSEIRDALVKKMKQSGVEINTGYNVKSLWLDQGNLRGVILNDDKKIKADKVIVATGGITYPETGSNGSGYKLAAMAGHEIIGPNLALVPIKVRNNWTEKVAGLKLKNIELKLVSNQSSKPLYHQRGELIIENKRLTGALALEASCFMEEPYNNYRLKLDLKPALSMTELEERLEREFKEMGNKYLKNSLDNLLPAWLRPVLVNLSSIGSTKNANQINAEERKELAGLFKELTLSVTGTADRDEAIITAGGVSVAQIDPVKLESKLIPGLHFAGEVLEPTAFTGGHNLQIAFSTGYLAGLEK
ncbi:MAG: NAD(P)/FAD-dependent oxidoreductase [Bacillota bacterium]